MNRTHLLGFAAVASLLLVSTVTHAYTPFTTQDGAPLFWATDTIGLAINDDIPPQFTADNVEAATRDGAAAWLDLDCAPKTLDFRGFFNGLLESQNDGVNAVIWLDETTWNARFSATEVARTIVTFRDSGEIVDADILVNAIGPDWGDGTSCEAGVYDFRSAMIHEFGHLLGLDHSAVAGSTMLDTYNRGECDKRDLEADDVDGYCATYVSQVVEPVDEDPSDTTDTSDTEDLSDTSATETADSSTSEDTGGAETQRPTGGSTMSDCAATGGDTGLAWLLLSSALLAMSRRRQRRRPSPAR